MTVGGLRSLLAALQRAGVDYVLIGGAALNLHGIVRATEAIDIMVRSTPDNVARLRSARFCRQPAVDNSSACQYGSGVG